MAQDLEICPGRFIGAEHPPFIIAEIGQNHQGELDTAKKMISAAAEAGVDCVKFQKSSLRDKFTARALARPYNSPHSWGQTYGDHKMHLEFSEDQFRELQGHAAKVGVFFTASAMDPVSAEFLNNINVPFIKIGSGDSNNLALLAQVARMGRPVVVSTGMCDMGWVKRMVDTLTRITDKVVILQCTSTYPCPPRDTCLRVMETYRDTWPELHVGYSGHEEGVAVSVAAAGLGARLIERHFTLDKTWRGSDHRCSLDPGELATLCHHVKNKTEFRRFRELFSKTENEAVKEALEARTKTVLDSEQSCIDKLGKTVVARRDIPANSLITRHDVDIKVADPPGIDPRNSEQYIGKMSRCCIRQDDSITLAMLECRQIEIVQKIQ